jgi:hypothetical protein
VIDRLPPESWDTTAILARIGDLDRVIEFGERKTDIAKAEREELHALLSERTSPGT